RLRFAHACYVAGKAHPETDIIDGLNFTTYAPAYYIAKKLKKPCVITYHETWVGEWIKNKGLVTGLPYEVYERMLLRLPYTALTSVSEYTRKRLILHGIPKEKIKVIPNGVDVSAIERIQLEKQPTHQSPARNPAIVCAARLIPGKRIDDLFYAIVLIKKKIPNIRCLIIGKGPEYPNLVQLTRTLNIRENVSFLGFLESHEEVLKIIKSSHIFCLPSVVEGFGIVVVEALACGVPPVCADIPPLVEVTRNGTGSMLFRQKSPEDLAEKLLTLLQDKSLYKKKHSEALALAKDYDWNIIARATEHYYHQLM
ncbi:glycosyltransferase family 1 protein, partial [Candidatus Woesearchaeota archaeon CG_4_10_14_0_8_um_filter_47_5]